MTECLVYECDRLPLGLTETSLAWFSSQQWGYRWEAGPQLSASWHEFGSLLEIR